MQYREHAAKYRPLVKLLLEAKESAVKAARECTPAPLDYAVATQQDEARHAAAVRDLEARGVLVNGALATLHAQVLISNCPHHELPDRLREWNGGDRLSVLRTSPEMLCRANPLWKGEDAEPVCFLRSRVLGRPDCLRFWEGVGQRMLIAVVEALRSNRSSCRLGLLPIDSVPNSWTPLDRLGLLCTSGLWYQAADNRGWDSLAGSGHMPRSMLLEGHDLPYRFDSASLAESEVRSLVDLQRSPEPEDWYGPLQRLARRHRTVPESQRWAVPPYVPGCKWVLAARPSVDIFDWVHEVLTQPTAEAGVPADLISQALAAELLGCSPRTISTRIKEGKLRVFGTERQVSQEEVMQKRHQLLRRLTASAKDALKRVFPAQKK